MRHNGLRASIPAAVATIATSPRRHGAAEGERPGAPRAGPPVPRSVRLRGTRGRGMATPMAPARTSPRTRAATRGASAGRGAVGAGRTGRGGVGTWKSGILGTCEAAARGRFSDFQDSRFSPSQAPHPPGASPGARLVPATPTERGE